MTNGQTGVPATTTLALPRPDVPVSSPPSLSGSPDGGDALDPPKTLLTLQLLRAWAALVVVIVHVGTAMNGRYGKWHLPDFTRAGLIGVDVFFCLSGFIMYYTGWTHFNVRGACRTFLVRRFLRIYPLYWVVTIVTLLVCLWPGSHVGIGRFSLGRVVTSFLLLPQAQPPVVVQGWTLVHEARFYAVFGILLHVTRSSALWMLTAWGMASFAVLLLSYVNQPLLNSGLAASALVYLCHPSSIQFVLGIWAAYVVRHCRTPEWVDRVVILIGITLTASVMALFSELKPFTRYYTITLFTIPSLLLVLGVALAERRWRPRVPPTWVALGNASYSTYLIHNVIAIPIVWRLFPSTGTSIGLAAGACALVAVIHVGGWLLHKSIEEPLHRLARQAAQRLERSTPTGDSSRR